MTTTPLSEALKLMRYISDAIRDPQELFRTVTDKRRRYEHKDLRRVALHGGLNWQIKP